MVVCWLLFVFFRVVAVDQECGQITLKHDEKGVRTFTFDKVFATDCTQESIYNKTAHHIVESVMEGYNGTIFAYGQTGTGKTFTMEGNIQDKQHRGIIPRTFDQVFTNITCHDRRQYLVRVSFIEIYNDSIQDLLNQNDSTKLELKEHPERGVFINNLTEKQVHNVSEIMVYLENGKKQRHTGETKMNRDSSRSHSIFTIIIESYQTETNDVAGDANIDGDGNNKQDDDNNHIRVGKLHLVDLAGSERQSKTQATGARFNEAININLSLSALGNVINSLTQKKKLSHIPYRDSKLTRILQDSLGGNAKTSMIANIGPANYNYDETMSTLRFASRAKKIENKPKINEDPKDALLRDYKQQILQLRQKLDNMSGDSNSNSNTNSTQSLTNENPKNIIVIEKIIEQKIHKKGISHEKVEQIKRKQEKEKKLLEKKLAREKKEWENATRQHLESKAINEDKLHKKFALIEKKRQQRQVIKSKLDEIQSNLMQGNKLLDVAKQQKIDLSLKKQQLHEKEIEKERIKKMLIEKEQQHNILKKKYDNQEYELSDKTNKLEKLFLKYQNLCQEIEDLQAHFQKRREELLEAIRLLSKQILLKDTIIQFFIPNNQLEKLSQRIEFDEKLNQWIILKPDLKNYQKMNRPTSCKPKIWDHPTTEWNRIQSVLGNQNPRHRFNNIIQLSLDPPQRTTQDYPTIQQQVQQQDRQHLYHQTSPLFTNKYFN